MSLSGSCERLLLAVATNRLGHMVVFVWSPDEDRIASGITSFPFIVLNRATGHRLYI